MGLFFFSFIIAVVSLVIFFNGARLRFDHRKSRIIGITGLVMAFILLLASMVVVIDAGENGLVIIFGKVEPKTLSNGINFVPPYANVVKYPTRIMEHTHSGENEIEARVNNGLTVKLDCTTLYSINPMMISEIYSKIAISIESLEDKILLPTLRTVIRNVVSRYNSEEVYSHKREIVATEIETDLREAVKSKGILIDKFLVRGMRLPEQVDKAIQMKISSQQESEAMIYKKQKAQQEAEIKIIEAQGLAKAQQIINSTLSPNYIQLEAIKAYRDLANSPNTTFVILPTSPNGAGIPLILNGSK